MTSVNIMDVSPSQGYPVNPYSKIDKSEGSAKDDFTKLLAGSKAPALVSAGNAGAAGATQGTSVNSTPNLNAAIDTNGSANKNDALSFSNPVNKDRVSSVESNPVKTVEIEEVKEAISDFNEDVKDALAKELDISPEEIEEAMETLGLSFIDLTQPNNLVALINEIKGEEDSVSLLLDTSVRDIFDTMGELTGSLFEETGLDTEGLNIVMNMEPANADEAGIDLTNIPLGAENEESVLMQEKTNVSLEQVVSADTQAVQSTEGVNTEAVVTAEEAVDTTEKEAPIIADNKETKRPLDDLQRTEPIVSEEVEADDTSARDALSAKVTRQTSDTSNQSGSQGSFQNNSQANAQTAQNNINLADMNSNQVTTPEPQPTFAQAMAAEAPVEVPVYTSVNTADVINQIVTQAQTTITQDVRSMELILNPQNLGRMFMQVSENDGQITARFVAQNEQVKEALEGAMTNLLDKLNEQGIKVNAVEVSVGTHEFEQNLEQNFAGDAREDLNQSAAEQAASQGGSRDNRSRGGIHLGDAEYMEGAELTEEEELTASIMRTYGNTVNFKA